MSNINNTIEEPPKPTSSRSQGRRKRSRNRNKAGKSKHMEEQKVEVDVDEPDHEMYRVHSPVSGEMSFENTLIKGTHSDPNSADSNSHTPDLSGEGLAVAPNSASIEIEQPVLVDNDGFQTVGKCSGKGKGKNKRK
jgi:hypothetical protein